jgi:putative transposase
MVSVDFFTVPTIRFQMLYVFIVLAHDRRRILHFAVTAHPTRNGAYSNSGRPFLGKSRPAICCGSVIGSLGRISFIKSTPWGSNRSCPRRARRGNALMSNGSSEPFAASAWTTSSYSTNKAFILYRHLRDFFDYYHRARTHLGLQKDTPESRPIQSTEAGRVISIPEVGGLHHRYERYAA